MSALDTTEDHLLISMLVGLRQENRQLADELLTTQMALRTLQDTVDWGREKGDAPRAVNRPGDYAGQSE